jgi:histidyl-tRNA synthetase
VVAEYRSRLPHIFKRYQIQSVYRADRPARGRWREFTQCDVDVVGSTSPLVESEVIGAAAAVLTRLGFGGAEGFAVRLNHRGVLEGLMEVTGVAPDLQGPALVAIDKLDKIGLEGVGRELAERGLPPATAAALLDLLAAGQAATMSVAGGLAWLEEVLAPSEVGRVSVANLRAITAATAVGPAAEHVRLDPFVARALSYYTGAIFEIAIPGLSSSGGGGGRYDHLIGMFSGQSIPACGFSLGLERLLLLMEERGLFPARLAGQPQVLVTVFDETRAPASAALAARLRESGLQVDLYPEPAGYGRQFKYAEARGIPYAVLLGPRESEAGIVAIRDLVASSQEDVPLDGAAAWLAAHL